MARLLPGLYAALAPVMTLSTSLADLRQLETVLSGRSFAAMFMAVLRETNVVELLAQSLSLTGEGDDNEATERVHLIIGLLDIIAASEHQQQSRKIPLQVSGFMGFDVLADGQAVDKICQRVLTCP